MRGSVVKKNDRWYVVIEDRDPATGKRKRRWHSGFRTKRDAQAACNELAAAMQRGDYLQAGRQTVGEFAVEWLATIAPTVRQSTLDKYQRDLRAHVIRHIEFVPLAKLDGPALNRLWAQLAVSGRKPASPGGPVTGLSAKSVENVAMTVHRMLRDAVRWGRIPKSPADMADPPKRSATHRLIKAWTADTLRTFLKATSDDELSALWMLIATSHRARPVDGAGASRASARDAGTTGDRCWPCWGPAGVQCARWGTASSRARLPSVSTGGASPQVVSISVAWSAAHLGDARSADGCPPASRSRAPGAFEHRNHVADLLACVADHARRRRSNRRRTLHAPPLTRFTWTARSADQDQGSGSPAESIRERAGERDGWRSLRTLLGCGLRDRSWVPG